MTLSAALRKGASMHPQCFGNFAMCDMSDAGVVMATCAIGAIADGLGLKQSDYDLTIPALYSMAGLQRPCPVTYCPCTAAMGQTLASSLVHLNDFHQWTREAIANWLEGQGL